ncbi:hypothetical protein [Tessaracoccus lacteus]|uniref:Uncharacterized protein n=1 Tax=Tessaracoccus lacteus TaxID=3041766 RepID=A0ABY8PZY6_9ACTN|nr:hypothetical protein [Tessaracoccus sp. T21]WGT47982.1 hypothetical protein QH948_04235 [Tessaracoccus sp. T21]
MPATKDEGSGIVVPSSAGEMVSTVVGKITSAEAFGSLTEVVSVVRGLIQFHETESTKREQLVTYRETQVTRLRLVENTLHRYLDATIAERHETTRRLFDSLDEAVKSGDVTAMQTLVAGIVQVAQVSPLADLGNLAELVKAMDDPEAVFEL